MGYKKISILARERRTSVRKEVLVLCDFLDSGAKSRAMGLVDRITSLQGSSLILSQPILRGAGAYSRVLYGETDDSVPAAILIDCPRRECGVWVSSVRKNRIPVYEFDREFNRYKPLKIR